MKLITRNLYLDKMIDVIGTPDIKVITGVRRSGKSKLLDSFYDYLKNTKEEKNIIRIKLNLKEYEKLLDEDELYKYVEEQYVEGVANYLLIDEIQLCNGFERTINNLHEAYQNIEHILTLDNLENLLTDIIKEN